ncbi:TetR/AcrR family transcriptional regulator [Mobilicoccus pelagius]|uniref:Putative TetR family transcriptional regulator n=1 Tax=Mobilicoccus pelagius NBRC 104925 TaxID=1089455 RepID=H5URQ2_9MICO|nr:TetR/AcrR family transcriptional regulator [Mobilicoccus pelagius]GAB48410.1 putative TetR family transcriptional regulator [Mobilicoccus pelagius NBRC 104925]
MVTTPGGTPSVPRGTRLPREERRTQLLAAAQAVFVESGYHAAGMDEIADRAGVSKPVLYQHFPGKLELYLALLDAACEQLLDSVQAALRSTSDNEQRVVATMEAYLGFVARNGGTYRLVFESDLRQEAQVADRVRTVERVSAKAVGDLVVDQTGLSESEAGLVATGVVGMAQTAARRWVRQGSQIPLEQAARLLAEVVWRGIRSFPVVDGVAQTR